jgi:hypothetical protein
LELFLKHPDSHIAVIMAGFKGFYRGLDANIMRAMVLNGTKMSCYDQIKSLIAQSGVVPAGTLPHCFSKNVIVVVIATLCSRFCNVITGLWTQFCAAFGAGFFMACTVSPFDMVRTRLMNQPPNARIYNNFVDCFVKVG